MVDKRFLKKKCFPKKKCEGITQQKSNTGAVALHPGAPRLIHSAVFRSELLCGCAAVRADAVLEVPQFMWQTFSTVIYAAVRTKRKKKLAGTVSGLTKGEEPRRMLLWPLSPSVALSREPPATDNLSLSD